MEYLLKTYTELKNKKNRKGFTLVELLVVIAILAVLASVSVVGYLGFTNKAKNSNALTELSQAKEVIRSELIDEEINYYEIKTESNNTTASEVTKTKYEEEAPKSTNTETGNTFVTSNNDSTLEDKKTYTITNGFTIQYANDSTKSKRVLSYDFRGEYATSTSWDALLKAIFTDLKTFNGTFYVEPSSDNTKTISSIVYINNNGTAKWTVEDDKLEQGVTYTDTTNNYISKSKN